MLIIRPGTDAALALGIMHVLIGEGLHDREFVARHTVGFDALAAHVAPHTAGVGGRGHRRRRGRDRGPRAPLRGDAGPP